MGLEPRDIPNLPNPLNRSPSSHFGQRCLSHHHATLQARPGTIKMAGEHDATESSWRPLAKLSGLISRRSSTKSKNLSQTSDKNGSVFRFKRQKNGPAESTLEFKRLEVELDALQTFSLPDGWLGPVTHNAKSEQEQPSLPASGSLVTPIASLFARESRAEAPKTSNEPSRPYPLDHENYKTKRPFSMIEPGSFSYPRAALVSTPDTTQITGSILDRGRPIEPKQHADDLVERATTGPSKAFPSYSKGAASEEVAAAEDPRTLKPFYRSVSDPTTLETSMTPQVQPVKTPVFIKRDSMRTDIKMPWGSSAPKAKPEPGSRSVPATPIDRIHAWQKNITSAPKLKPPSASASVNAAIPPQANLPARKLSTRGAASDRLAWIRELEEKKSANVNRDIPVLKKQGGSVSDKLAMFENKQTLAVSSAAVRRQPLTRSNSSSRFSAAGLESIFSSNSNVTTASPRTSIDTVRSINRASSVMSYYDDSFREKMENVVGGYVPDKEKSDVPEKPRTSAPLISEAPVKSDEDSKSPLEEGAKAVVSTKDSNEPHNEASIEASNQTTIEASQEESIEANIQTSNEPGTEANIEASNEASIEPSVEATVEATVQASNVASVEPSVEATVEAIVQATVEASVEANNETINKATIEASNEPSIDATIEASNEASIEVSQEKATEAINKTNIQVSIQTCDEPSNETSNEV